MLRRIDTEPVAPLVITAGNITGTFVAGASVIPMSGLDSLDGAGRDMGPKIAQANELELIVYKVQGSADEIWVQVQEANDAAFTVPVVVPVRGAEHFRIDSSTSDSTYVRLGLVPIRGKYARVLAKYDGGAATSAAVSVLCERWHNDQLEMESISIVGPTGLAPEVRKTDLPVEVGMARQTQRTVSGGAWAANVVTFTTSAAHGWVAGDSVTVAGCGNASYDRTHTVVSAPTGTTFTAALTPDPGAFTTGGTGDQAQSTTRLVDEDKSWTANEFSAAGCYVQITDGTGMTEARLITSNGTHWVGVTTAFSSAPVTDDSKYKLIETDVPGLVVNTEATVSLGDVHLDSEAFRYRSVEPDLVPGESTLGSVDKKGNLRVAGAEAHNAAVNRAPVLMGGYANDAAPTDVADGDVVNSWHAQNGATVVAGYNEDGASSPLNDATAIPIGTDNLLAQDSAPDIIKIGGEARAGGATYTEGDSAILNLDLKGNLRIGGSVAHNIAATGNPVLCGAYASDVIQTAVSDAGDAVRLWASLSGAICTAGLYQHGTPASAVAMTSPVVIDDAVMVAGATAVPVAGQYNATALTYTDKDAAIFQMNDHGALITTGAVGGGTPIYGRKTIGTPGTEEPLHADQAVADGFTVMVKALHTNTDAVVVGANGLTTGTGYPLYPGEEVGLAVTNLNLIYVDAVVATEGVAFIAEG